MPIEGRKSWTVDRSTYLQLGDVGKVGEGGGVHGGGAVPDGDDLCLDDAALVIAHVRCDCGHISGRLRV